MASIVSRHAELAGWVGGLSKMAPGGLARYAGLRRCHQALVSCGVARRVDTECAGARPGPRPTLVALQLWEDQGGYVASILSRRARLLGLMRDSDKTPLPDTVPFLAGDRTSRIGVRAPQPPPTGARGPQAPNDRGRPAGHVCHNPRPPGPVGHKPRTTAGSRLGMSVRGRCHFHPLRSRPGKARYAGNVASACAQRVTALPEVRMAAGFPGVAC